MLKAGQELLLQEHGDEGAELELGAVTGDAVAILFLWKDGLHLDEAAQSLAGGPGADVEPLDDLFHGEGLGRGKEEAVDGAEGGGVPEEVG